MLEKRALVTAVTLLTATLLSADLRTGLLADEPPSTPDPAAILVLFNGRDLEGWREPHGEWTAAKAAPLDESNPARFKVEPGTGILVNGAAGKTVNLLTVPEHADVIAHIEFMVPKGSNSGIYFQGRYEIQVLDSYGKEELKSSDCGGIYQANQGFAGKAPAVNASRAPGEWQSFDVIFRAPRFDSKGNKTADARFVKVVHNGKVIHENVSVDGPTRAAAFSDEKFTGPLMLQGDHGPVAYRNLWLKPIEIK